MSRYVREIRRSGAFRPLSCTVTSSPSTDKTKSGMTCWTVFDDSLPALPGLGLSLVNSSMAAFNAFSSTSKAPCSLS